MATNLYAVTATVDTADEVDRLMKQQAEHHNNKYTGTRKALAAALDGEYPLMKAFFVYDRAIPDRAVCCAMYRMVWTPEGRAAYLEDICTDKDYRGGGVGRFAIEEMRKRAREDGAYAIIGAVAKDNTATMKFWLNRKGEAMPKTGYDLTNLFNDHAPLKEKHSYTARRITAPHDAVPATLQGAEADHTTGLYIVRDEAGEAAALAIVNAKFSSSGCYRSTVVEPVAFLKPLSGRDRVRALKAAFDAALDFARTNGYADHLYGMAHDECDVSNTFLHTLGHGPRQESDDPASLLVCMRLGVEPDPAR